MADDNNNAPKAPPAEKESSNQNIPGSLKTRIKEEQQVGSSSQQAAAENNHNKNDDDDSISARSLAGKAMTGFSDVVNDNLIAFRYGTVATVTLLTAYGLANTPLFFRYKTARDIPAQLFQSRNKRIRARIVKTLDNDQAGQPLVVYARHLSPAASFLSSSTYDFLMRTGPSAAAMGKPWESQTNELIKVEIAGLSAPPFYTSHGDQRGEWLKRLAREKTMVKLQLMGRRVPEKGANSSSAPYKDGKTKRDVSEVYPDLQTPSSEQDDNNNNNHRSSSSKNSQEQTAVCKLYYRPTLFQVFATDVADPLVRYGHASVNSEIFTKNEFTQQTKIVDASTSVSDLRKDIRYLEGLEKLEYEAAKGSYGMWSDSHIREMRRDVIDEVEFQKNASIWQKLWRRMRG